MVLLVSDGLSAVLKLGVGCVAVKRQKSGLTSFQGSLYTFPVAEVDPFVDDAFYANANAKIWGGGGKGHFVR